jgi:hypothetical protein
MKIIPDLWRFAQVATYEPAGKESLFSAASIFVPMNNDLDYGYIAEFPDRVIICFRGTKGKLESWVSDFDPYPLRSDEERNKYLSGILKDGAWGKGIIHDGFYTGWSFFKPIIEEFLVRMASDKTKVAITKSTIRDVANQLKPIYVTGHSRGGALCTLCARHIAKNLGLPCSCISFGAPAQGTKEYRDQLDLLPINHTRVTHGYDIVPEMPPYVLGFRHGGKHLWLSEPAIHKLFHKIRDHFYSWYVKGLIRYCKKAKDLDGVQAMKECLKTCPC